MCREIFEIPPLKLMANLRHLWLIFSSDFPRQKIHYDRIAHMLAILFPASLRSLCFQEYHLEVVNFLYDSLQTQTELEELRFVPPGPRLMIEKRTDFPFQKVRIFEGHLSLPGLNGSNITDFYLEPCLYSTSLGKLDRYIRFLQIFDLNYFISQNDFRRLASRHPEIEVLGILYFGSDNMNVGSVLVRIGLIL